MARTGAIKLAEPIGHGLVRVITTPCVVCEKEHIFVLPQRGYEDWQYGELIQNAFPDLSAGDRETLISGTCDECFNTLFPPD